jgi:hypothetical protein
LVLAYQTSLSSQDRDRAIRAVSDYVATQLPMLPLYWLVDYLAVRKGADALGGY